MTSPSVSFESLAQHPGKRFRLPRLILNLVSSNVSVQARTRVRRIGTTYVFGSSLMENEVGRVIDEDFLPKALAQGRYVTAPEPFIAGKGLDSIQAGFDAQIHGVSAKKIVVSL